MIAFNACNHNGVEGVYNLKTGQFVPKCCTECSRLIDIKLLSLQKAKNCSACIFLPINSGKCKRQLKDQILINLG